MLKVIGILGIANLIAAIFFAILGDPWWTFVAATIGGNLCGIVTAEVLSDAPARPQGHPARQAAPAPPRSSE